VIAAKTVTTTISGAAGKCAVESPERRFRMNKAANFDGLISSRQQFAA
jgi:hypothetical protein